MVFLQHSVYASDVRQLLCGTVTVCLSRAAEITSHLALEMYIVQIEVYYKEEVLTEFRRFSVKRRMQNILVIFILITHRHNFSDILN